VRIIIDAQLPLSPCNFFREKGIDAIHTLELPKGNRTTDAEVLEIAASQERVVISKDVDFLDSFLISGKPRKLIVIRTGNISNPELLKIFETHFELVTAMISRSNLVEISKSEIAEHE
jgi:predicted nuclease of predicted toxin-antitoxin system